MLIRTLRLAGRSPRRAWLMARMAGWMFALSVLVKICSLPRALRMVSTFPRDKRNRKSLSNEELASAADTVLETNIFVFKPNCWKRATVLHRYLALQGVSTTIVFGLRKEAGELKGHAWLESEGRPILESSPPAYKVTYTFPSAQSFDNELALMASLNE